MDGVRRLFEDHDDLRRNWKVAVFIVFILIAPQIIGGTVPNLSNPAPGMTSSAFLALQMAAKSVWPLHNLASVFAFLTIVLKEAQTDPAMARIRRVSLVVTFHSCVLSTLCLNYTRMCPLTLLSGFAIMQGLMVFLTLLSFFFFGLVAILLR